MSADILTTDVLVIGGGLAGERAAIEAAVAGQFGPALDHKAHGIAGGVAVDAAEDVPRHG